MTDEELFIETIAPIVQKYAGTYGINVASPIIAQACCESAYGKSWISREPYFNLFGMKAGSTWSGRSVSAKTKEEYTVGTLTSIIDNFRAYDSLDDGIKGYFDFISTKRYEILKSCGTPLEYLEAIKKCGYATSSAYVSTNMRIVERWGLTRFDGFETATLAIRFSPTKGEAKAIQQMLNSHNFLDPSGNMLAVDGIVGDNTKYALKNFCNWYIGIE